MDGVALFPGDRDRWKSSAQASAGTCVIAALGPYNSQKDILNQGFVLPLSCVQDKRAVY